MLRQTSTWVYEKPEDKKPSSLTTTQQQEGGHLEFLSGKKYLV